MRKRRVSRQRRAAAAQHASPARGDQGKLKIPNPYYDGALQPLFNTGGWYTPYDVIPSPFNAANGYEVPDVASLILNYRHNRFAITPSLHYANGSNYGSPLVWPGYVPQSCAKQPAKTPLTPGVSCPGGSIGAIFLPDPYSGQFDNLGAFMQPARALAQSADELRPDAPRMTLTFQAVNLYNHCFQRGYRLGQLRDVRLLEPAVEHSGARGKLREESAGAAALSVRNVL